MNLHDAHFSKHGKNDETFTLVFETMLEHIRNKMCPKFQKPTVRMIRDRFRAMLRERISENSANNSASHIAENVSESQQRSDDFILAINDAKQKKKIDKEQEDRREG